MKTTPHSHACGSLEHDISRRQVLGTLGGAAGFGSLLQPGIVGEIARQKKQVCLIWLDGGISQYESWHPLPQSKFAGPFRSISTSIPGVHFSELVPHTAKIAHKISVIRTMATKDPNHSTGVPRIQRGDPVDRGVEYPHLGSAVAKLLGPANPELPPTSGSSQETAASLPVKRASSVRNTGRWPSVTANPRSIFTGPARFPPRLMPRAMPCAGRPTSASVHTATPLKLTPTKPATTWLSS